MGKIADYKCDYGNSMVISSDAVKSLNLEFPDAYKHWDTMASLAKAVKKYENGYYCELPFCHTVEGEAMGGIINFGDEHIGPRAKDYICNTAEDLLNLPEIDYSSGRISEVLKACRNLRKEGENVVLSISGPFTILNVLIDATSIFKIFRKSPEKMQLIFDKLQDEILRFMGHAQDAGVNMISYADSSGGVNILGPKLADQMVEMFTYPMLKKAESILNDETIIFLCPKTTLALIGTEKANRCDILFSEPMSYIEGCFEAIGKAKYVGEVCIKNSKHKVSKISKIKLI